ncbi:MAG: DUF4350 domain-containing protein [Candidatus Sifarchaeia archaeon]
MKRVIPMILIVLFLGGLAIVPSVVTVMNNASAPLDTAIPSQNTDLTVRVAIFDEDDTTVPTYSNAENLTNHLDEIETILEDAGHTVTLLAEEDILDHELITANFDVFVLVNSLPNTSIVNLVKEFWMGGGGVLSFHGSISYLWYAGMLDPTSTTDGYVSDWLYLPSAEQNVTSRHPTMKDFHINDTVSERAGNWATTSTGIMTNIEPYCNTYVLLSNVSFPFLVTGFAIDQASRGGRIVQLPGDGSSIPTAFESIIVDSVEWLMPRPKARIVFDMSHSPRIGIDSWDWPLITVWSWTNNFGQLRTLAVNHSYTFDKLYPLSTGNLTTERLSDYDILVVNWPDLDYTSAERTAVENWIADGGTILVLGDRTGLTGGGSGDEYLNQLLQNFDMSLGTSNITNDASMTPASGGHVTLESCDSLSIGYRNYLVVIGNATEIWMDGTECVVAAEEFGQGRAILSSDMNIFDNSYLGQEYNVRFALNVLEWLSAVDAEILVHTDYLGWNDAVCRALRDLGLSYQLFNTRQYLDDFLDTKTWDLLIYNNVNYWPESLIYDELYAFVNGGGTLILTSFTADTHPTHPLWSKMGVEWSSSISGEPTMYLWDTSHPIFTEPNDHSMSNYSSIALFGDDGDTVTYSAGYTALAGTTAIMQSDTATIVVSNDRKTLFNTIIIDNFQTDEDDSTYADNVELWQNEIVFMMTDAPGGFPIDMTTLLIIGGAVVAVVVILGLLMRRRGGSASKPKPKAKKKK